MKGQIQKQKSSKNSSVNDAVENIILQPRPEFQNQKGAEKSVTFTAHMGPLPSPACFEGYEKTLPGSANRILTLAEEEAKYRRQAFDDEAKHRRKCESQALNHNIYFAYIGQFCAFLLAVIGLGTATYCAIIEQPVVATTIAGAGLAALIGPFLKNLLSERIEKKKEDETKSKS